ncbi:dynamin family protein [Cytobacillus suaedae]|nr:dynamin family protein [Cytobacillus suaedae]
MSYLDRLRGDIFNQFEQFYNQSDLFINIRKKFSVLKEDSNEKVMLMIMGEFKSGKSTFLNAIMGMDLLRSDVTPATAVSTIIKYGPKINLTAHFKNGSTKTFEPNFLHSLSAEGDQAGELVRQSLDYLVLEVPNDRLKEITLIDTPGLNAGNDLHTDATKRFIERTDDILYLFKYGMIGRKSEIGSIEELRQRGFYPLGVVNAIDLHFDQSTEDLDEFLTNEKRKLQDYVRDLIGVSSIDALEGQLEDDPEKMEWSNFEKLTQEINEISKNQHLKESRILTKLSTFFEDLYESIENQLKTDKYTAHVDQLEEFFNTELGGLRHKKKTMKEKIKTHKAEMNRWNLFLAPVTNIHKFKIIVSNSRLSKQNKTVLSWITSLENAIAKHKIELEKFEDKKSDLEGAYERIAGTVLTRFKRLFASKKDLKYIERLFRRLEHQSEECTKTKEQVLKSQQSLSIALQETLYNIEKEMQQQRNYHHSQALSAKSNYDEEVNLIKNRHHEDLQILNKYLSVSDLIEIIKSEFIPHLKAWKTVADNEIIEKLNECIRACEKYNELPLQPELVSRYAETWETLENDDQNVGFNPELSYKVVDQVSPEICFSYKPRLSGMLYYNTRYYRPFTITALLAGILFFMFQSNPNLLSNIQQASSSLKGTIVSWIENPEEEEVLEEFVEEGPVIIGYAEIIAIQLNIRSGPGMDSEKIDIAYEGETFEVFEEYDGWLRIGVDLWISGNSKYVLFNPE